MKGVTTCPSQPICTVRPPNESLRVRRRSYTGSLLKRSLCAVVGDTLGSPPGSAAICIAGTGALVFEVESSDVSVVKFRAEQIRRTPNASFYVLENEGGKVKTEKPGANKDQGSSMVHL